MAESYKPFTYLDRKRRSNNNYFFISYRHDDYEKVYEILNNFYEIGLNYWYDTELMNGDKWIDEATKALNNKFCVGVIFFVSYHSIVSDAIDREIEIVNKIKKENPNFQISTIIISDVNTLFNILSHGNYKIKSIIPENREEIFSSVDQKNLIEDIKKVFVKCNATETIDDFMRDSVFSYKEYEFGYYYVNEKNKKEIIKWLPIYFDKKLKYSYFVSEYALDFCIENDIENKIIDIKNKLMDNENQKIPKTHNIDRTLSDFVNRIVKIDIVSEDILKYQNRMGETVPTNYADMHRSQFLRMFWVRTKDGKYKTYNSNNNEIIHNLDLNKIDCGLRFMLVIDESK